MPELPEVETVREQLHARLANAKILEVEIWRSGREEPRQDDFIEALEGAEIDRIDRRAKVLFWYLKDGRVVLAHLKMTGRFSFVGSGYERQKHDRIQFTFQTAQGKFGVLVWADVRQFGYLKLVSAQEAQEIEATYGLEPLITAPEMMAERLHQKTTRAVKVVLLDQGVLAGIGNIYADEACFRAKILPMRPLSLLTKNERFMLATQIQAILQESLAMKGTSAHTYVDTTGTKGGFVDVLNVYGRKDQPCVRCETPITKIMFRGRGTHYCKTCQK